MELSNLLGVQKECKNGISSVLIPLFFPHVLQWEMSFPSVHMQTKGEGRR